MYETSSSLNEIICNFFQTTLTIGMELKNEIEIEMHGFRKSVPVRKIHSFY